MTIQADSPVTSYAILETARKQVLEEGVGLTESQLVDVLRLPDDALPAALQLAHEVRLRHCGEDVEVEGIVSIKTG
ncbi:MAG: biotin synthase BioB, partial [Arthrobacter sp.]|nr:biotin synthase BioB [Arthrobacter sp.]